MNHPGVILYTFLFGIAFWVCLIVGCSDNKEVPIDLRYDEDVTITHPFYGTWCCKAKNKFNSTTYRFICESSAPANLDATWINGKDVIMIRGCQKECKENES